MQPQHLAEGLRLTDVAWDSDGKTLVWHEGRSDRAPHAVTWSTTSGATVYGLYYAPSSTRYHSAGLPPALLLIHGGPTAQALASFQPTVQFFTTRGYAVLQVNYRGSTGYGKAYVDALRGAWGWQMSTMW
jgi:dipeptidyl aminopeptidase/acylaminoacyl peptidase